MTNPMNRGGAQGAPSEAVADPAFAAIERHRLAYQTLGVACRRTDEVVADREGRKITAEDEAFRSEAGDAEAEAMINLLNLPPLTKAGALAALAYLCSYSGDDVPRASRYFAALLRSPVLTGEA